MNKYSKRYKSDNSVFTLITFIFKLSCKLPWWISFGIFAYLLTTYFNYGFELRGFVIPFLNIQVEKLIKLFILFLSILFLLASITSYRRKREKSSLLNKKLTIQALYQLNWEQLEDLVKLLFLNIGYKVKKRGGAQADGGVDIEAYKKNEKVIIQCKQWKSNKVGVAVVREMFGVMIHEKAQKVYIITCGSFTKDAKEFAKGKPIYLIHGFKLVDWVNSTKGIK